MKARKVNLGKGTAVGNLYDLEQGFSIHYLEKEKQYSSKIELAIYLKSKDNKQKKAYRSLRFNVESQLRGFIITLVKAYAHFLAKRDKNRNFELMRGQFVKDINDAFINELKNLSINKNI